MGRPHSESEVYEVVSTLPDPEPNIDPEGVTPPNTSPVGDTTQKGADTTRQHRPYQQNQWYEAIWECVNDNKLKQVHLNKLNRVLYALNFGMKNVQPMAQKMPKKRMRLKYKQYTHHLQDAGDTTLQNVTAEEQCPTVANIL